MEGHKEERTDDAGSDGTIAGTDDTPGQLGGLHSTSELENTAGVNISIGINANTHEEDGGGSVVGGAGDNVAA